MAKSTTKALAKEKKPRKKKEPNRTGQTMSGYVDNDLAAEVRDFMESRKRSLTEVVAACIKHGLPILRKLMPPVKDTV